jgi:hypothetical protein
MELVGAHLDLAGFLEHDDTEYFFWDISFFYLMLRTPTVRRNPLKGNPMRTKSLFALLLLVLPLTAFTQNLYPRKDLAFAQIAAGGGYETVLNVTNRGTTTYNGTLSLFQGLGTAWSPLVNGNAISNGQTPVVLGAGATATLRITVLGNVEVGFGIIKASDQSQTSFLEGTLTYYVMSGSTVLDSVGVQPSSEVYLTTIPFDDFSSIALALANDNTSTATVKLTLFSETNSQVENTLPLSLQANQHVPKYLSEFFQGVQMTGGRLEIQSDLPILETALTDVQDQLSSLPLLPAVKTYTFTMATPGGVSGEMSLWVDGFFVSGYARTLVVEGQTQVPPLFLLLSGVLYNGVLQLNENVPQQFTSYLVFSPFSLAMTTVNGSSTQFNLNPLVVKSTWAIVLTATN